MHAIFIVSFHLFLARSLARYIRTANFYFFLLLEVSELKKTEKQVLHGVRQTWAEFKTKLNTYSNYS